MKNHLRVIVLLSLRQINSQQSAHFHFTNFTRFNVPLWYYTNTEKFGIRPSQYWYFGIEKTGDITGIPVFGIPVLESLVPNYLHGYGYGQGLGLGFTVRLWLGLGYGNL